RGGRGGGRGFAPRGDLAAGTDDELGVEPLEHGAAGPGAGPWPPSPPPRLRLRRRLDLRRRLPLHLMLGVGSREAPPRLAVAARVRLLASAPAVATPHSRPRRCP